MSTFVQPLKPAYYTDVERQLGRFFYEILYAPLLEAIGRVTVQETEVRNAPDDPLKAAIRSGRIQYAAGVFTGEFNAAISKALRRLGATFNARSKTYVIEPGRLPAWIMTEAASYRMKAEGTHQALLRMLDDTTEQLERIIQEHPINPDKSIEEIASGFKHAAEALKVSPRLTPEAQAQLRKAYTDNMKLWIDKFSREEITALRQRVELNALQGYRFDHLISSIKNRYGVSQNKAAFLARQETSLFLAKFREKRFLDAGVRQYRWSTAHDSRVRHDHRRLNGNIYSYDDPPIVDLETSRRGNPGQDYNCRCVDIPVFQGQNR